MQNCLQNFFQVHQRLLRRWDFCHIFYFLLEKLLEFVLTFFLSLFGFSGSVCFGDVSVLQVCKLNTNKIIMPLSFKDVLERKFSDCQKMFLNI